MKQKSLRNNAGSSICDAFRGLHTAIKRFADQQAAVEQGIQQPQEIRRHSNSFEIVAIPLDSRVKFHVKLHSCFDEHQCSSYLVAFREESDFAQMGLTQGSALKFRNGVKIVSTALSESFEDAGLKEGITYCYTFVAHIRKRGTWNSDILYESCEWIRLRLKLGSYQPVATVLHPLLEAAANLLAEAKSLAESEAQRYATQRRQQASEEELREQLRRKKEELVGTQTELDSKRNELCAKEKELQTERKKLQATQAEFHALQEHLWRTQGELRGKEKEFQVARRELQEQQQNLHTKLAFAQREIAEKTRESTEQEKEVRIANEALAQANNQILQLQAKETAVEDGVGRWVKSGLDSIKALQQWETIRSQLEASPEFQALPENERQFFLEKQRVAFFHCCQERTDEDQ